MTLPGALLDGAGIGVATATWHLMGERQKRRRQQKAAVKEAEARTFASELDEVKTLRRIVDNIMVFLVGRKSQGGLPGPDGFLTQHQRFQETVMERLGRTDEHLQAIDGRLSTLAGAVQLLTNEWKPDGGHSSYDRLRRLDERGGGGDADRP